MKIAAYNVSTVDGFTTKYKTPSLAFIKGGVTYYIPLISPNSHYDVPGTNIRLAHNGERAIRVRYNGSTYAVPTSQTSISTYDIPAGTYSEVETENTDTQVEQP